MLIVDCHCHAGPGDGLSGPWDSDASLGAYMRAADAAGIDRTVLFPVFHPTTASPIALSRRSCAGGPTASWASRLCTPFATADEWAR